MFRKSAHLYDAIYSQLDYAGYAQRLHELIQERNRGASTLLDVACGTGGHLEHLRDRYRVEGVDLDPGMLDVARRKLPDIPFHLGDMVDFSLDRRFDAVICMFSSIGYVRTVGELERAVANMAAHLEPGGILIVEPWFRPEQWEDDHLGADFVDQPELKIARMHKNRRDGRLTILEMHHLVSSREGVDYLIDTHELFLFTDDEYSAAFVKAGLRTEYDAEGLMGRGLFIGAAPGR